MTRMALVCGERAVTIEPGDEPVYVAVLNEGSDGCQYVGSHNYEVTIGRGGGLRLVPVFGRVSLAEQLERAAAAARRHTRYVRPGSIDDQWPY